LLLVAGLLVIPVFATRLSIHILTILLFLDVILLGVFDYGSFRFLGLRAGFFDIFILISSLVFFARLYNKIDYQQLLPFLVYLVVFLLSVLFKPHLLQSGAYYWQLFALENMLITFLAITLVDSKRDARVILGGVAVIMTIVGLYFFTRYWQHGFISFGGGEVSREAQVLAFPENSPYRNRNSMAAQVVPILVMLIVFTFELKSRLVRLGCAVAAALIFLVVLASTSRGAAVATVGGTGFYLFLRFRAGRLPLFQLVLIGASVVFLTLQTDMGQKLMDRFFQPGSDRSELVSDYNRISLIKTSASLIRQSPFLGVGFNEENFLLENEKFNFSGTVWAHPHNSYLYIWVFGGTLTFVSLIWVIIHLLMPIWRGFRRKPNDPVLMAVLAAMIGMLIDFATDRTFFIGPVSHLFFALLASAHVYSRFLLRDA